MASKKKKAASSKKQNFANVQQDIAKQFQGLDMNDLGRWPLAPRIAAYIAAAILAVVVFWFLVLSGKHSEWSYAQEEEGRLRSQYTETVAQAVNLPQLRQQQQEVQRYVEQLEQQLPSKANMDVLLADINAAGIGNHLEFEELQADPVKISDYYVEQPISILAIAPSYQDMVLFAADLAKLSRIVTLDNIKLEPEKASGNNQGSIAATSADSLRITATLKTYRYLDADDMKAHQQATARTGG